MVLKKRLQQEQGNNQHLSSNLTLRYEETQQLHKALEQVKGEVFLSQLQKF
jgi:hypothetical protein